MQITLKAKVEVETDKLREPSRQELVALLDWCLSNMTGNDLTEWVKSGEYVDFIREYVNRAAQ